jgi:hypothetical protein
VLDGKVLAGLRSKPRIRVLGSVRLRPTQSRLGLLDIHAV